MILRDFIKKENLETSKKILEFEKFFKSYKNNSWLDKVINVFVMTFVFLLMYELMNHYGNKFLHFTDILLISMIVVGIVLIVLPIRINTIFLGKSFVFCAVVFSLFYGAVNFVFIIPFTGMILFLIFNDKFLFSASFVFFSYPLINLIIERINL